MAGIARKDVVPPPGENRPDILEETMYRCFPPEAEDLKLLIKQMLHYDIRQRLKQKQCINGPMFENVNQQIEIPHRDRRMLFPAMFLVAATTDWRSTDEQTIN
jgi:hypothetical protein